MLRGWYTAVASSEQANKTVRHSPKAADPCYKDSQYNPGDSAMSKAYDRLTKAAESPPGHPGRAQLFISEGPWRGPGTILWKYCKALRKAISPVSL